MENQNENPLTIETAIQILPELMTLGKEAREGIGIQFTDAPTTEKRKEAREAFMALYAPIDKLRDLPDWVDHGYEAFVDGLLDRVFQEHAQ